MKKLMMMAALGLLSASTFGAELTFGEFKEACQDPDSYGHQLPPGEIKVICADEITRWIPVEGSPFELPTEGTRSNELFSDKHHVALEVVDLPPGETGGECPNFREDIGSAVVELSLSCQDVINEKRDLDSICEDALADAEAANPDIREYVATGRTGTACGPIVIE